MNNETSLGTKLKSLREQHAFTQEYVGQLLCVSRQTISNWENDKNQPDKDSIIKLCELYNISPNQLYGFDNEINVNEKLVQTLIEENHKNSFNPSPVFESLALAVILVLLSHFPYIGVISPIVISVWLYLTKRNYIPIYILCILCFFIGARETYISLEFLLDLGQSSIEKIQ